jgi:isopenicillin-N epimerase
MIANFGPGMRERFALEPDMAFLNHGSYGAAPKEVLAVQGELRGRLESQPVRFMSRELPGRLAEAGAVLAEFVGAKASDLAFVENATAGCNAVLRSLHFKPGDEILITDHIYPAVRNILRHVAAESGAVLVEAHLPFPLQGPQPVIDAVTAKITDCTKLVVLDHITSPTATILPAVEIAAAAKKVGARVLLDAAHAPGHIDFDVTALGADWVTGNAHKWLFAPKGAAFLWAAAEAQEGLHPTVISHGYGKGFQMEFGWTGTRDPSAWLAVPAAIDFYKRIGGRAVRSHNQDLARRAADLLMERLGTGPASPASMRGAMATIELPTTLAGEVDVGRALNARIWEKHRIEVPIFAFAGKLWVRISAQVYNELAEYEELAAALKKELN